MKTKVAAITVASLLAVGAFVRFRSNSPYQEPIVTDPGRYAHVQFTINGASAREGVTIEAGTPCRIEVSFERVVFWKELDETEASIFVDAIREVSGETVICQGCSLRFVEQNGNELTYAGTLGGIEAASDYQIRIEEAAVPGIGRSLIWSSKLVVTNIDM